MSSVEEVKDVQLLRAICNNTFEKIAKSVSEEQFSELLRGFVASKSKGKSKIRNLYEAFQSALKEELEGELDSMIQDENFNEKFAKRADLLQKQKEFEGTTAWRPSGDPVKDQRSHDMDVLIQMKTAMEEYLQEKEPYIEELCEKVRLDAKKASDLQTTFDKLFYKMDEENANLDEFEETHLKLLKGLAPMSQESEET